MNYFKDFYHICVNKSLQFLYLKKILNLYLKSVYSKNLLSLEVLGLNFKDNKNQEIAYFLDCSENENKAHPKSGLPFSLQSCCVI